MDREQLIPGKTQAHGNRIPRDDRNKTIDQPAQCVREDRDRRSPGTSRHVERLEAVVWRGLVPSRRQRHTIADSWRKSTRLDSSSVDIPPASVDLESDVSRNSVSAHSPRRAQPSQRYFRCSG